MVNEVDEALEFRKIRYSARGEKPTLSWGNGTWNKNGYFEEAHGSWEVFTSSMSHNLLEENTFGKRKNLKTGIHSNNFSHYRVFVIPGQEKRSIN